jgi:CO/xanthine dehydrogenase FAD-binding subunit
VHPFDYEVPETVDDALALLAEQRDQARVLAGGQSLIPILNYRLAKPQLIVDINDLPDPGIRFSAGRLQLGALVRHHALEESPEVARHCPILAEAAALIGNVRVRSLGTVGGSLAHADPAAELPMVMAALEARLTLRGRDGSREVAAGDFFTGTLTTALRPGELLTLIDVPDLRGVGWAVEEFSRRAGDFAVVGVAALVSVDSRGRVDDVRLAYAGVADRPVRGSRGEDVLRGQEPTAERVAAAAAAARDSLAPASDAFVSAGYRSLLAGVLGRRALSRAVARAMSA